MLFRSEIFQEVASQENDEVIRYRFGAETGDKFQVKVTLKDDSFLGKFQL